MLHLVLKTKWFRMIESGEKLEEYRDVKPFWLKRIFQGDELKHQKVRFRLGYASDASEMTFDIASAEIASAKPEWAEVHMGEMIVIRLGNRLK